MDLWQLPQSLTLAGKQYGIRADFRDILEIFGYFQDESLPAFVRWQIALELFYKDPVPAEYHREAMEALRDFICCGREEKPGPRLLDWQYDAQLIVADVNKAAGQEIRALPFVHWWTFLSWFHAIGQGQLSTVVAIRDKLRRGKRLEDTEREFYKENRSRVDLPKRYSPQELLQQQRIRERLDGV